MFQSPRKNNSGFSLVEIMMSIGMIALIILGIASTISQQSKAIADLEKRSTIENDFNTLTRMALNPNYVGLRLNIKVLNSSKDIVDNPTPPPLANCLAGAGTQCDIWAADWQNIPDPDNFINSSAKTNGENCNPAIEKCAYTRYGQFKGTCTTTACSSISVRVGINPTMPTNLKKRAAEFQINQQRLLARKDFNFACAQSGFISSIDYENLKANCNTANGSPGVGAVEIPGGTNNKFPPPRPSMVCPNNEPTCKQTALAEYACPNGFTSLSYRKFTCLQ